MNTLIYFTGLLMLGIGLGIIGHPAHFLVAFGFGALIYACVSIATAYLDS
jgi:hypothetical protein